MKTSTAIRSHGAIFCLLLVTLTGCGGSGGDGGGGGGATYTIGGAVNGLTGSGLVLQNNGDGDLAVSASGAFTFAMELASGSAYAVTVMTQPTGPAQDCVVTNGSGTVAAANVTNVEVACTTLTTYTVGGTITGLAGSGLVLQNNSGDDLSIGADGPFTFSTAVASGTAYSVSVATQPSTPTQNCVVTEGTSEAISTDVTNIAVECEGVGRFAYVANAGDNTVTEYSIDPTSGALAAVGIPVATGLTPYAIAGSPDKRHVYVVNQGTNNISAYAVDATSGALTQIAGSPFAAGNDPQALAFDPSGTYLYVADAGSNDLSAYVVDAGTGVLTPLPTPTYATGTGPSAVAVDRTGKFVFVANNGGSNDVSVFTITAGTGELTPVTGSPFAASSSPGLSPQSVVFVDSAGFYGLYVSVSEMFFGSWVSSFSIDHDTGTLTLLTESGGPIDNYIATDRNGVYLYVTTGDGVVGYATLDAGQLGNLPGFPVASGTNAFSVTVDPSNQFVYVANDGAASVSGYKRNGDALQAITGSPFAAGHNPDFLAIL